MNPEVLMFFSGHEGALPLYTAFEKKLLSAFPDCTLRVFKTQISFYNRHLFACVSFARVKRKAELPEPYLVVTLGLPYRLASNRVAIATEPYPGRWTTHIVVGKATEIDEELFVWVKEAYDFALSKK